MQVSYIVLPASSLYFSVFPTKNPCLWWYIMFFLPLRCSCLFPIFPRGHCQKQASDRCGGIIFEYTDSFPSLSLAIFPHIMSQPSTCKTSFIMDVSNFVFCQTIKCLVFSHKQHPLLIIPWILAIYICILVHNYISVQLLFPN